MRTKRFLKNRQIVIEHISSWMTPLSVEEIYFKLIEQNVKLSISTVYKHVQILHEDGLLSSSTPHRTTLYQPAAHSMEYISQAA